MRCKNCGEKNPIRSRYCIRCGSAFSRGAERAPASGLRLRALLLTAAGLVLLFGLAVNY